VRAMCERCLEGYRERGIAVICCDGQHKSSRRAVLQACSVPENSPVDGLKKAVAAGEVGLVVAYRLHVPEWKCWLRKKIKKNAGGGGGGREGLYGKAEAAGWMKL
jgi:hypothetical protein